MKRNFKYLILTLTLIFLFFIINDFEKIETNALMSPNKEKIIYLTFDDGPSKITNNVLDTLKEKGVCGTFFLIGKYIKGNEKVIMRIFNEGHSIGLHSYTHNTKALYSNKDLLIREMINTRDLINSIIGVTPNIIRFPGGSTNRLSVELLTMLHNYNFKIYDWNMEINDGLNPKSSPDKLYREATKGKNKPDNIILLLHCDSFHINTCTALPKIIDYYKKLDYTFKVINDDTPEYYFRIRKCSIEKADIYEEDKQLNILCL